MGYIIARQLGVSKTPHSISGLHQEHEVLPNLWMLLSGVLKTTTNEPHSEGKKQHETPTGSLLF